MPHLPSSLINTWQIYFGYKLNRRRDIWIAVATVYVQTIYSVLMSTLCPGRVSLISFLGAQPDIVLATYMRRTKDRAVPI